MLEADVVLCAASTSLYHTAAKAAAQRAGRAATSTPRIAPMHGGTAR